MIRIHASANDYLDIARPFLEIEEAKNNLLIGLATALSKDSHYYGKRDPLFITIQEDGECICACLCTPPKNLILNCNRIDDDRILNELVAFLVNQNLDFPGIIGPKDIVLKFNKLWEEARNITARIQYKELVYRLDKVNDIEISPGHLRQAQPTDIDLISEWIFRFNEEALEPISMVQARHNTNRKINEGAFYIWETDRPVSMAGWTRPMFNGVTISAVYTPPELRGNGYASSCVARLTELMLMKYKFCCLFTNQANPTSNSIYQKIGYVPLEEVYQCEFV